MSATPVTGDEPRLSRELRRYACALRWYQVMGGKASLWCVGVVC